MRMEKDYEEFLRLLNRNKVRYCIVGSYAVAVHSVPRYTKDIDIWVEPGRGNAEKIIAVLREFGFGALNLNADDFASKGKIVQLGYEPVRIDLITSIPGCSFARAWKTRRVGTYGAEKVNYIGKAELLRTKRASGRKQDDADIELLSGSLQVPVKRKKKG